MTPTSCYGASDALAAKNPSGSMRLQLCLRAADGIVLIDTCPSKETFESFVSSGWLRELRQRAGLPEPHRSLSRSQRRWI